MPMMRNPFTRRPGQINTPQDENARPGSATSGGDRNLTPSFERVDTVGSKASSSTALSIRSQDTGEYKMSVVNDSGVYLPPSPTAEKRETTWPRRYLSRNSTDTRSDVGEIEHFSISRESFDSYRRSFDISARSPVIGADSTTTRQSLDSARFPRLPRASSSGTSRLFDREPPTTEESQFEDVGLNDEQPQHNNKTIQQPARRRGFFSKFGTTTSDVSPGTGPPDAGNNVQAMSRFLPGRKRGHSGQGAELGAMPSPTATTTTPAPATSSPVQAVERPKSEAGQPSVVEVTREEVTA